MSDRKKAALASCANAHSPAGGGTALLFFAQLEKRVPRHTDRQRSLEYCQMDSFILLCGQNIFFSCRDTLVCMFWVPISFSLVDVTNV